MIRNRAFSNLDAVQPVPDLFYQVLRGRHTRERRHLVVQMPVIHQIQDFPLDDVLQELQVHDHASHGVRLSFDRHLHA